MLPGMQLEARGEGGIVMPEFPMRFHMLAPDGRCPSCGSSGLTFVRVRGYGDLHQCKCKLKVMHYRNTDTKTCGYAAILPSWTFGKWTACVSCDGPGAEG
jgi:hypothetical protein